MPTEVWRPVPGFEDHYEVSACGQVKRIAPASTPDGRGHGGTRLGRVLKPAQTSSGYLTVSLFVRGKSTPTLVHRLVTAAFLGPRPDGHEVNHRDGDKRNNVVANLEYVTRAQNVRHAFAMGLNQGRGPGRHVQPCGTSAAYSRHRRLGQPIDEQCRQARNAYKRARWVPRSDKQLRTVALRAVHIASPEEGNQP